MDAIVFDITKKAHSTRFGPCHRCTIARHKIPFADATAIVANPHRAVRGLLDWVHGCATLRPVLAQVGDMQRIVANFCEMAERVRFELTVPLRVRRFSRPLP